MTKRKYHHVSGRALGALHTGKAKHQAKRSRTAWHFAIGTGGPTTMEITSGQAEAKKRKHEAHMIPGVDGHRIWGFPNSIITKLRYCAVYTLSGTSGVMTSQVFAANGIYDPDITGVGHQPMYRDNYAALYDQYVVLGSKITATFLCGSSSQGNIVGIVGDDDSSTAGTLETLLEQNNSVSAMTGSIHSGPVVLTATYEPLLNIGVDAKDDGASATVMSANPTELYCFKLFSVATDLASTTTTYVKVEIDYTVKFTELQTPTQN